MGAGDGRGAGGEGMGNLGSTTQCQFSLYFRYRSRFPAIARGADPLLGVRVAPLGVRVAPLGVRVAPGLGPGPVGRVGGWTADELPAAMLLGVGGALVVLVAFGGAQPHGQRVCLCGLAHASPLAADG